MGVIFLFSRCFFRSKWTSASDVLPSIFLAQTSTDAKIQQNDETRWSMWKHRSFFSNAKNNQNKQRVESTTNNKRSVFITINSILVDLNKHLIAFKFDDIHVFMPIFFLFFSTKQRLCGEQNETLLIWVMDGAQQTSPSNGDREWANNRTGNSSQHHRANASYRIAGIVWWFTRPSTLNVELK